MKQPAFITLYDIFLNLKSTYLPVFNHTLFSHVFVNGLKSSNQLFKTNPVMFIFYLRVLERRLVGRVGDVLCFKSNPTENSLKPFLTISLERLGTWRGQISRMFVIRLWSTFNKNGVHVAFGPLINQPDPRLRHIIVCFVMKVENPQRKLLSAQLRYRNGKNTRALWFRASNAVPRRKLVNAGLFSSFQNQSRSKKKSKGHNTIFLHLKYSAVLKYFFKWKLGILFETSICLFTIA